VGVPVELRAEEEPVVRESLLPALLVPLNRIPQQAGQVIRKSMVLPRWLNSMHVCIVLGIHNMMLKGVHTALYWHPFFSQLEALGVAHPIALIRISLNK